MLQCLQIPAIPSKIRTIYAAIVGLEIVSVRTGCTCKKHDGKICGKHGNCMDCSVLEPFKRVCQWPAAGWCIQETLSCPKKIRWHQCVISHSFYILSELLLIGSLSISYSTEIIKWPWAHRAGQGLLGGHLTQVCFGMVALIPSTHKVFTDKQGGKEADVFSSF